MPKKLTHDEYVQKLQTINPHVNVLETYNGRKTKILHVCTKHDENFTASPDRMLSGCLYCSGCKRESKENYGFKFTHDEFVKMVSKFNPNIKILSEYLGTVKKVRYKCTICDYEGEIGAASLLKPRICTKCGDNPRSRTIEEYQELLNEKFPSIICSGQYKTGLSVLHFKCLIDNYEWDDIARNVLCTGCKKCNGSVYDTEWYVSKLKELSAKVFPIEDYVNSTTKILHKCSDCGKEIYDTPNSILTKLKRHQTVCSGCSDGTSYANKFSYRFFDQFRYQLKTYIREYAPDWCVYYDFDGNMHHGKYDNMMIFKNGLKLIVEMDGNYHYEYNKFNKHDTELSRFFDMQKDYCANDNGFIIIRVDCNYNNREDRFKYIKNSMENNILIAKLFDLTSVNWDEIAIKAEKSSFIEACELWNCGMKIIDIAEKIALCTGTIRTYYLKNGTELGLCYYNPVENKENILKIVSANRCKSCICLTTGIVFQSIKQAENFYKANSSAIVACCKGKKKHAGEYNGMPLEWAYV